MMLRDQLAAVPRWRVALYAFLSGAALTLVLALVAAANGLVTPPVEREVEMHTVFREKATTKTAKRSNIVTTSTPGLLRVPDGGVLLAYTTVTRDLSTEDLSSVTSLQSDSSARSKDTPVLPSWSVGVLVGGQFAGKPALMLPQAPGIVLGVTAGYRVPLDRLGVAPRFGLWVEAWGTTSGAAGGGLRGEF